MAPPLGGKTDGQGHRSLHQEPADPRPKLRQPRTRPQCLQLSRWGTVWEEVGMQPLTEVAKNHLLLISAVVIQINHLVNLSWYKSKWKEIRESGITKGKEENKSNLH